MRYVVYLAVGCLLMTLPSLCQAPLVREQPIDRGQPIISVTGTAQMEIPADFALIKVSINTLEKDVDRAQLMNDEKAKQVLLEIQSSGILAKDISTDSVTLEKKETEQEHGAPVFQGYLASNQIKIILRDLKKYDALIKKLIIAGIDEIDGVYFGSDEETEKRKEVRVQAIKAAKEKADYLAVALGEKVCKPIRISESSSGNSGFGYNNYTIRVSDSQRVTANALAPRRVELSASVDVTFLLCP